MEVTVFNRLRTFNVRPMRQQLGGNGIKVRFAGFTNDALGRVSPFTAATKIISQDGVAKIDDVAARGDIRIVSAAPLTAGQTATINAALDAHDDTIDTVRQQKERAAEAVILALKAQHDGGIANPVSANLAKAVLFDAGQDV